MRPTTLFLFLMFCMSFLVPVQAGDPVDFNQPQTPAKPTPAWVKMVDLGQQDPRLKGYQAPEGIKVEIVAENPVVINPVGMTFGPDGTPYVLEWRPDADGNAREFKERITYRDGSSREIATMRKQVKDVVKILRDTKGNGIYDEAKVILEEELPSSILIHEGWLYLSGRGTVRRYRQSKPGGPYDVKEVIAKGFCGFHHHQVSGLTIGPEGWLYITSGDDDNVVEGSDGSRATALRTGAVFRCRPDGSRMHLFAQGFRNPYRDVAFDAVGNMFHVDNDNEDGSKFMGCRLMHIAEGNDFGWRLRNGARCCVPDPVRGAAFGELPGTLPPLVKTGRGAPAGLLIYNDTRLPESFRGLLYYPDVLRRLVRAYRVQAVGAGFEVVEEFELLRTNDPLFRPCQMVVGPDGAIYVVDWRTDSGGAGRLWGDGKNGRIYRLSWSGAGDDKALPLRAMDTWEKISKQTQQELIQSLSSDDASVRQMAQKTLRLGDATARAALLRLVKDGEAPDHARLAALGVLPTFWNAEVQAVCEEQLFKSYSDLRRACAQTLGLNVPAGDKDVQTTLLKALVDQDPGVRRAVALAMGRLGGPGAADALVNMLASDDGKDYNLRDGLVRAVEALGKPGIDQLMSLAESGVAKDLDRVVETFAGLRSRAAADAVPTLLKNPHLSIAQRAQVLASLNNYLLDPPLSLDPAVDYLLANPNEAAPVKLAGLQILSAAVGPRSPRAAQWLLSLLTEAHPDVRLAAIQVIGQVRIKQAAARLIEIAREQDHPLAERTAAIKALQSLEDKSAVPLLQQFVAVDPATPAARTLRLEAFRALAMLDPVAAQEPALRFLESKDEHLERDALQLLGSRPAGARQVARLFLDGKLPREWLSQVADALSKHESKDHDLISLREKVVKSGLLVGNRPDDLARLRRLVGEKGNPQRGRALYLDTKALACITCHRLEGVGGNIGPDLTRLWETQSLDKLVESILEPSKEIKEGFQTWQATTKQGQVISGLKRSETADEVVLREPGGRDVRLAKKDLEELKASARSLMPDHVAALLRYEQLLDLLAFLRDRTAQESLRGLVLDWNIVGPLSAQAKIDHLFTAKPDLQAGFAGSPADEKATWQVDQADPKGVLKLSPWLKGQQTRALALTFLHSPRAQNAALVLASSGQTRLWINGKLLSDRTQPDRQDEVRSDVKLEAGWTAVLVEMEGGEGERGLSLRFLGEGLRLARNPSQDGLLGGK